MYKVIKHFVDLQDSNHPYYAGDEFPRSGVEVTEERIAELAGSNNLQKTPLIRLVEEAPVEEEAPKKAKRKAKEPAVEE